MAATREAPGEHGTRSRPLAEASPRRRALRRDGPREVVEHQRPARAPRGARPSSRLSTHAPVRAGTVGVRRCCAPLRRGLRSAGLRHAMAPARSRRGGLRRALGALARQRGRLDQLLREARVSFGQRPRRASPRLRARRGERYRGLQQAAPLGRGTRRAAARGLLRNRCRCRASGARLRARRTLHAGRALREEGRSMKASSRANVVSSFTIIKGAMIEETYAVFAAWDFERSKRENLDRLREQNFIGAKSTAWLRDV